MNINAYLLQAYDRLIELFEQGIDDVINVDLPVKLDKDTICAYNGMGIVIIYDGMQYGVHSQDTRVSVLPNPCQQIVEFAKLCSRIPYEHTLYISWFPKTATSSEVYLEYRLLTSSDDD